MKTVLVTGAARRIGRAIARRLFADGWRVLVHARREGDSDALALAEELGGVALFGDLSDPLGPARLFNAACEAAPELCALVNNAAAFNPAADLPEREAETLRAVNLVAPEKLSTMLGLRLMTNDENGIDLPREGAVVNLLDSRILGAAPSTPYERAKAELMESGLKTARQFAAHLRVNAVAPGPVLPPTEFHESAGDMLLARRPTPEDVADAVAYLVSARSVTGAVIPVDSGQSAMSRNSIGGE